jgi:hypothetical protein
VNAPAAASQLLFGLRSRIPSGPVSKRPVGPWSAQRPMRFPQAQPIERASHCSALPVHALTHSIDALHGLSTASAHPCRVADAERAGELRRGRADTARGRRRQRETCRRKPKKLLNCTVAARSVKNSGPA